MTAAGWASLPLLAAAAVFFLAGTVGLLRFPDAHSRLHAITKTDNLGLGFLMAGLALQAGSAAVAVKLLVIWLLMLLGSATSAYLIARHAEGEAPSPEGGSGDA